MIRRGIQTGVGACHANCVILMAIAVVGHDDMPSEDRKVLASVTSRWKVSVACGEGGDAVALKGEMSWEHSRGQSDARDNAPSFAQSLFTEGVSNHSAQ